MKRACGTVLLMYLATAAVLAVILYRRMPVMGSVVPAALVAAVPGWFGITYLWEVARRIASVSMIRRAQRGDAPRDGKKIAAVGRITPNGPLLVSPFTKTPCVIYDYKISTGRSEDDTDICLGFAQTPSTIQGRQGGIRLLAYPDLKFAQQSIPAEQALPNAREYMQETQFQESSVANIGKSLDQLLDIYKDDDGSIRYDNRMPSNTNIETCLFFEKVVRPGDEVCAIGLYSAQRGGIVPNVANPLIHQATLEPGGGDAPLQRARKGAIGYSIGAAIFLGVLAGAGLIFMANVPLEEAEQQNPQMNPTWPEIRLEWFVDRWVRTPMRQAGMISAATFSNNLSTGTARGRVEDTTVSRAEATRRAGLTTVRLGDDTVVLTIDSHNRPLQLRILGRDVPVQSAPLEVIQEERAVTGRLNVPGELACHVAFRAGVKPPSF